MPKLLIKITNRVYIKEAKRKQQGVQKGSKKKTIVIVLVFGRVRKDQYNLLHIWV